MKNLFNMSEAVFLAVHSLTYMARKYPERVNIKELAKNLDASEAHLSKILQRLKKSAILDSVRGPNGGYTIRKEATGISILDIYEAIETQIDKTSVVCPFGKRECIFGKCLFGGKFIKIYNEIYDIMKNTYISDYIDTKILNNE